MSLAQKVVLSSAMASGMVIGAAHADALTPEQRFDRVKYQTLDPGVDWSRLENRRTITAAFRAFGMGNGTAMCVASHESGLNEDAWNSSGASGLFQHLSRYWDGRVDAYNRRVGKRLGVKPNASVYSARANALVSAQMVRNGGWSPWTTSGAC